MINQLNEKLDKRFLSFSNNKLIHEAICYVENSSGSISWHKSKSGLDLYTPFIIASITKLFTTACIFNLGDNQKLSFNDKISKYIDEDILKGLCVLKGEDYTLDITINNLIFQNSGIEDVYENGNFKTIMINKDYSFDFEDICNATRKKEAIFKPSTPKKAYYSDLNFDLLGKIIEKITGRALVDVYKEIIINPLNLKNTYLVCNEEVVPEIYYRDKKIHRPKALSSSGASGGIVSNAKELMCFIKAFFMGKLFAKENIENLPEGNSLQINMFPIKYNKGFMEFKISRIMSPFCPVPKLIGHSGSTGSFAFFAPDKDIFMVGNLNQMADARLPFQLMAKISSLF